MIRLILDLNPNGTARWDLRSEGQIIESGDSVEGGIAAVQRAQTNLAAEAEANARAVKDAGDPPLGRR